MIKTGECIIDFPSLNEEKPASSREFEFVSLYIKRNTWNEINDRVLLVDYWLLYLPFFKIPP